MTEWSMSAVLERPIPNSTFAWISSETSLSCTRHVCAPEVLS